MSKKLKNIAEQLKLLHGRPDNLKGMSINLLWNLAVELETIEVDIEQHLNLHGINEQDPNFYKLKDILTSLMKELL